jgi:hypothetical protein
MRLGRDFCAAFMIQAENSFEVGSRILMFTDRSLEPMNIGMVFSSGRSVAARKIFRVFASAVKKNYI